MTVEEFKEIYEYIIRHHHGYRVDQNSAQYYGAYNGDAVTAECKNLGMDRYIHINGKTYYTTCIWGEYDKGVKEL